VRPQTDNKTIALLTDFGLQDSFVGVLKAVINKVNPSASIIDITHGINPQDILQAAFQLSTSFTYFPKGTIFCVVVDPGVGSKRNAICIKTEEYYFVGPDNGVLYEAASRNGIEKIINLTNRAHFLDDVSNTFHGRDIFAPVSAAISLDQTIINDLGDQTDSCIELKLPQPIVEENELKLKIINIDRFGNATLNMTKASFLKWLRDRDFTTAIGDVAITRLCDSYAQAEADTCFLIEASSGNLEISIKNGSAADRCRLKHQDEIKISIVD
jgi:S-adenosylmethionine hydrolase